MARTRLLARASAGWDRSGQRGGAGGGAGHFEEVMAAHPAFVVLEQLLDWPFCQ